MCVVREDPQRDCLVKDPELVRGKEPAHLEFMLCAVCAAQIEYLFRYLDSALYNEEIVSVLLSKLPFKRALLVFSSLTDNLA